MPTYVPINSYVFVQAFTGAVAGLLGQSVSLSTVRGTYTDVIDVAGGWAQEVDTQWAISFGGDPDLFEFEEILSFSEQRFQTINSQSALSATYTRLAQDLMAILADGEAYFAGLSVIVPPIPSQFVVNVKQLGAEGDEQRISDASIVGDTIHAATGSFVPSDTGKLFSFYGAGPGGVTLYGTITYVDSGTLRSSVAANISINSGVLRWATDDYDSIVAALDYATAATIGSDSAITAQVWFPPGGYGISRPLVIDSKYDAITLYGSSSSQVGLTLLSRVTLFTSQPYAIQNTRQGGHWQDLWIDGNRLADSVGTNGTFDCEYPCANQTFDRIKITGACPDGVNLRFGKILGQLEIDFLVFRTLGLHGDPLDFTYTSGWDLLNDNAEAFEIDIHNLLTTNATVHVEYDLGSCNIYGWQWFVASTAALVIGTSCASCEVEDVYNEGDTCRFLSLNPTAAATGNFSLTLRRTNLHTTPIYTAHTMRLVLESCSLDANITSDPAAAIFNGQAFGIQPLISKNTQFQNEKSFIYASGIPGQLVREKLTGYAGAHTITVNDGAMSSAISPTTLTCGVSAPFARQTVGCPIVVAGAGIGGAPLNAWIEKWISTTQATLTTAASTTVNNSRVNIGNTGTLAGPFGYTYNSTTEDSPSEQVNTIGYDADDVQLGVGKCPVGVGVPIIAADFHVIQLLTANRDYYLSQLGGVTVGTRLHVNRYVAPDAFGATIHYDLGEPKSITLTADQWAAFEFIPNSGWVLDKFGTITNQQVGSVALVNGTATIEDGINVTANSIVFITRTASAGTTTNTVEYSAPTALMTVGLPGIGSIIISAYEADGVTVNNLDTSTVGYLIVG